MSASHKSAFTSGTVAVDPASISGVEDGELVIMYPPAALEDDLLYVGCRIKADDTVTIFLYNPTGSAIDGSSRTWSYVWYDRT